MNENGLKTVIFASNQQKILDFLLGHPEQQFYDRQIAGLAGLSKSGTNLALRKLAENKLLLKTRRGRMNFYSLNDNLVLIKHLKIMRHLVLLAPLVERLKPISLKVVLFGSAATGEDTSESDIDLFILTREPKKVGRVLMGEPLREKIRSIVKSPQGYGQFKKDNKTLIGEINNGVVLWQEMRV